jgi:hypothetical protein
MDKVLAVLHQHETFSYAQPQWHTPAPVNFHVRRIHRTPALASGDKDYHPVLRPTVHCDSHNGNAHLLTFKLEAVLVQMDLLVFTEELGSYVKFAVVLDFDTQAFRHACGRFAPGFCQLAQTARCHNWVDRLHFLYQACVAEHIDNAGDYDGRDTEYTRLLQVCCCNSMGACSMTSMSRRARRVRAAAMRALPDMHVCACLPLMGLAGTAGRRKSRGKSGCAASAMHDVHAQLTVERHYNSNCIQAL